MSRDFSLGIIPLLVLLFGYYYGKEHSYYWLWKCSEIGLYIYAILFIIVILIIIGLIIGTLYNYFFRGY